MQIISKKNPYIVLMSIFLFFSSLFIRIEYRNSLKIDNPIMKDAYYHFACAYNIAKYNIFSNEPTFNTNTPPHPNSFLAPGFPFLLASALKLGNNISAGFYSIATLYNAVLGAFLAPMVFYICIQFLPLYLAISATLLTIFSPHLISIGGYLLTETLFTFCLISSIVCFLAAKKNKSLFFYLISGFLMSLSYLTNPIIFFLPSILSYLFIYSESKKNIVTRLALFKPIIVYLFFFIIITGFWEIRNIFLTDKNASSSNNRAIINIINGLYPDYHDNFKKGISRSPEYSMNKDIIKAGGSFINTANIVYEKFSKEPIKYLKWYLIEKPLLFWSWDIHIGTGDIYVYPVRQSLFSISSFWGSIRLIFKHINPMFTLINIIGLCLIPKLMRDNYLDFEILLISIILLYSTFIYTIFYPDPRYSIPFRPLYYVFFIWTLNIIIVKFKNFLSNKNAN